MTVSLLSTAAVGAVSVLGLVLLEAVVLYVAYSHLEDLAAPVVFERLQRH